jgi:pyruvate dehydrogenase E2 component (dihydrolipoamide acetyltransferase)
MSELVMMPKLGFDMASGTLVNWVKDIGDAVNKGDILVEVETDKATVEVEAFASGILKGIFAEEGAIVPVGALIGVIASEDEQVDLDALDFACGPTYGCGTRY